MTDQTPDKNDAIFSAMLNSSLNGVFVLDANYQVTIWNQRMESFSQIQASQAIGEPLFNLFPTLKGKRIELSIKNAIQHNTASILSQALNRDPFPLLSSKDDGTPIKQTIHIKPIQAKNDVRLCMVQIQDVTPSLRRETILRDIANEAEDAKESAEQLTQVKTDFISTVSHELRTPLTSILGSLGLVCGGVTGELPTQAASLVSLAYKNGQNLLLLINDLLDIDKIESGNMEFNFKNTDVMAVVDEAINRFGGFATAHNVTFKITQHLKTTTINVDAHRLMQVMSNLLSNAAKFSPQDSTVEISTSLNNNKARISVRDHGTGIPENFIPKLFDKFTQSDSSDTRIVGGTGLGLSISKAIIEQHGGDISVESELGEGTTFHVDLPIAAETAPTNNPHL